MIVAAAVYNVDRPYSTECADPLRAHVARYAWGDDYHDVIEQRLDRLLGWMREHSTEPFDAKRYVDTGPVQERVYAQHAGIGWIGKNTCVIHPMLGSWLFLGEIICSLPLEPDPPDVVEVGGPEALTRNEAIELAERTSGRKLKRRRLPRPVVRVAMPLLTRPKPALASIFGLGLLMDLQESKCDDTPLRERGIAATSASEHAKQWPDSALKLMFRSRSRAIPSRSNNSLRSHALWIFPRSS